MQAIVTKFFGPTNVRGSRVKAQCDAGNLMVHWNHALGIEANHRAAAQKLAEKLGWHGQWIGGSAPGSCYCFVCNDPRVAPTFEIIAAAA